MNWKIFDLKYENREKWAFEQLSYLLFCAELENRVGLFRYKNQAGIETEPMEVTGKMYGFQAKHYTTSIAANKEDIIDAIQKAERKNTGLDILYLYVNQELSESSKRNKKKPEYQIEIEQVAKKNGITIQWRTPSHFELQLSLPENKYINDLFFSLGPGNANLMDEIISHNQTILNPIQTFIPFKDQEIKINQSSYVNDILQVSEKKNNIIISGEGGCGKTSILKEFYYRNFKNIPFCIFKATELNVNHVNDLFRFGHNYSLWEFLEAYKEETLKIFVIDSAEKLAEITNNEVLNTLLSKLVQNGWLLMFTTRYSYLNDLKFHIKENYQLSFDEIDIPLISKEKLKSLEEAFEFNLPENPKFLERLCNLFYLREYIRYYSSIDKKADFSNFISLVWKKRIQNNSKTKNNLHIERERCILNIAKQRAETGRFYISAEDLPEKALFALCQDEILGYDEFHDGYFITHDIYEEWALNKIVSRKFVNSEDSEIFFNELGDSLPIRRAFRLWLSEELSQNSDEIKTFIHEAFINKAIVRFWKDELLVSVLLSNYSSTFFRYFENEIIANDFQILKRILFLLRIACTDISSSEGFEIIKPKGNGWQDTIALIYKYRTTFFDSHLNLVSPVLTAWCDFMKEGDTTRYCGLLALSVIQKTESGNNFYIKDKAEENILKIIFNSAQELKVELEVICKKVLANNWRSHNDPYEGFCVKILEKPYLAKEVIKALPLSVIQLCNLFWKKSETPKDFYGHDRLSMEYMYGLEKKYRLDYHPASAHQTPIYWLLQVDFKNTIGFIVDFTNYCVESYRNSEYGEKYIEEITLKIETREVKQYLSGALWGMYRGIGSPVVPYLLQSIHMALEKVLLDFASIVKPEFLEHIFHDILSKSKSASLTSVVCSIVLANPNKFYETAKILFKTIELFHHDTMRSSNEFQVKSLNRIGYGLNGIKDMLYSDERLKTCEEEHRNTNLESLLLNYQFTGIKDFTKEQNEEFIEQLYTLIDEHKASYDDSTNHIYGILLARVDRRNLIPNISEREDNKLVVEFSPKELPGELREQSERALLDFQETFKYSYLKTWSDFDYKKDDQKKNVSLEAYDKEPLLALAETRELVEELNAGRNSLGILNYSTPAYVCYKLLSEHIDLLSTGDKVFCKEIILSYAEKLFSDDYDYQIGDGVEAAIRAIPSLMKEYPEEIEQFKTILLFTLFNTNELGAYKRICDYAIESIHLSDMWKVNFEAAQSLLLSYIRVKPIYKDIIKEKRNELGYGRSIGNSLILEELDVRIPDFSFEDAGFEEKMVASFKVHDLEIVYQLIPSDTEHSVHLDIFQKTLPFIASQLLIDRRTYEKETGDRSNIYLLRIHIFERCARFILHREKNKIGKYLLPFEGFLSANEETAKFISEFIKVEDSLFTDELFWEVWRNLYPHIVTISENHRSHYTKDVLINYLLAWPYWREGIEEWRSLKEDNLSVYSKAAIDLGHIPAVLYSLVRVLNTIGSRFRMEGLNWIHTIVSNNKTLTMEGLESNTIFYLEKYLRRFIFNNRQKLKKEIRLKNKVIPILDFMIERGSVHGYLLRENIL